MATIAGRHSDTGGHMQGKSAQASELACSFVTLVQIDFRTEFTKMIEAGYNILLSQGAYSS